MIRGAHKHYDMNFTIDALKLCLRIYSIIILRITFQVRKEQSFVVLST